MNSKSLANLTHSGRPAAFGDAECLAVLEARKVGWPHPITAAHFVDVLLENAVIPRRVCAKVILDLCAGRSRPHLLDPKTGFVYDYSTVPQFKRGAPVKHSRAVDPVTGEPIKRPSKIKQHVDAELNTNRAVLMAWMERQMGELKVYVHTSEKELKAEIAALRARLDKLSPPA